MEIVTVNSSTDFDEFITQNSPIEFLQTYPWGEFQNSFGREVYRLMIKENQKIISTIQFFQYPLPLKKNYLYCPHGPIIDQKIAKEKYPEIYHLFLNEIKKIALEKKSTFLKIEPLLKKTDCLKPYEIFSGFNFQKTKNIQPADTLILNLSEELQNIWQKFSGKTRYNIRLAEKKGVKITIDHTETALDDFFSLLQKTCSRQKIKSHSHIYYRQMLNLGKRLNIELVLARYQEKTIASGIFASIGNTAYYLHGASDYGFRSLMAPHLLQWEMIKKAKEKKCLYYDFFGIAPINSDANHPWAGITRFKRGFSGEEINYLGCFDLIFQPTWYKIYTLAKKILR